jgi:hypothetical protein
MLVNRNEKGVSVSANIQELRGEIKALDARITALEKISEARFSGINSKLDARFSEVNSKIDSRFSEINFKVDSRFSEVNTKLDAILNLHDLQVRISKLESQRTA